MCISTHRSLFKNLGCHFPGPLAQIYAVHAVHKGLLSSTANVSLVMALLHFWKGVTTIILIDYGLLCVQWLRAMSHLALEAVLMPLCIESNNSFVEDRQGATCALGREQLLEVIFTVRFTLTLIEWGSRNWLVARTITHKMLLVPCLSECFYHFLKIEFR